MLLVLEKLDGVLLLVDPDWQKTVDPPDRDFILEMLKDLGRRTDRKDLFEQLREVNWGPLVTQEWGTLDPGNERLAQWLRRFVPA